MAVERDRRIVRRSYGPSRPCLPGGSNVDAGSVRHSADRLHVDAFPTRPMAGRRILRVFSNVADDGSPRRWRVGEPFADFAPKFPPKARKPSAVSAWAMQQLGLSKGRRTPWRLERGRCGHADLDGRRTPTNSLCAGCARMHARRL
jgi:hypothetical protein